MTDTVKADAQNVEEWIKFVSGLSDEQETAVNAGLLKMLIRFYSLAQLSRADDLSQPSNLKNFETKTVYSLTPYVYKPDALDVDEVQKIAVRWMISNANHMDLEGAGMGLVNHLNSQSLLAVKGKA